MHKPTTTLPYPRLPPSPTPSARVGLLQRCSAELFGRPVTLASCVVIDSLYKTYAKRSSWPRSTLSVCWRLGLAESEDSAIFYAKVYLEGRSLAEWQRLMGSSTAVMHVPALDMIAWRFPQDPSMPHLAQALLPGHVRHHLPYDQLPPGLDGPADLLSLSAELLKYLPENCCTVRWRLQWRACGPFAPPQELIVFGKTFRDDRGRVTHKRLQHCWQSAAVKSCRPLGYDAALRTVWSLGVEGLPLVQVINRANHAPYLERLGRSLAAVHAGNPDDVGTPDAISVAELLADCLKKIDKLSRACPPCAQPLSLLAESALSIGQRLAADGALAGRVLHGDFHIDQVLAHGDEIYLFDFDSFALGDPEQDLAEFIVGLLFYGFEPDVVRLMAQTLVQSYSAAAPWAVRYDRLRWYAQVEHVTRAYRFYRQQRPGWEVALQKAVSNLEDLDAVLSGLN